MVFGSPETFLLADGPTTFGASSSSAAAKSDPTSGTLNALSSWFHLDGRPDFRPHASRAVAQKRKREEVPQQLKRQKTDSTRTVEPDDSSISNSYSWTRWYSKEKVAAVIGSLGVEGKNMQKAQQISEEGGGGTESNEVEEDGKETPRKRITSGVSKKLKEELESALKFEALLSKSLT